MRQTNPVFLAILFIAVLTAFTLTVAAQAQTPKNEPFAVFAERVAKVNAKYKVQQVGEPAPAGNSGGLFGGLFGGGQPKGIALDKIPANEGMSGYKPDDWEATGKWALSVAADLSSAMAFGKVSPELVQAAGLAASVYPHPVVLNNYAALLQENYPADALFFGCIQVWWYFCYSPPLDSGLPPQNGQNMSSIFGGTFGSPENCPFYHLKNYH